MAQKLAFVTCPNLIRELELVISKNSWNDVESVCLSTHCFKKCSIEESDIKSLFGENFQKYDKIEFLCGCFRDPSHAVKNCRHIKMPSEPICFNFFTNPGIINDFANKGCYMITPGWLAEWEKNIESVWGFTKPAARSFFKESNIKKIILLDTGIAPPSASADTETKLDGLSKYLGLKYESLPVGLEYFGTVLGAKRNSWLLEKIDEKHRKQIGELNRKLSYNLSAFEFTSEIAGAADEKSIAKKIIYLFDSLFAPSDIVYYSLVGPAVKWRMARDQKITPCENEPQCETISESAEKMAADKISCLANGEGFKVFIGAPEENQGMVIINRLKFPHYINDYMELAESVANISSIAISNARKYEKIEAAVEEARKASSVKSSFLANMSHELRTPISSIIGFCDLAHSKEASAETREFIGYIKLSSRILLSLVNNILDFSKTEAGGVEIENIEFSPGDIVRQAAGMVKVQADAKKVNLEHRVPDPDRMLIGDAFKLRQVLLNLLSNAVKFSDRGTVFIEARALKDLGETVEITFSVKDEGIGIEESKKDIIFKPFSQADGSVSRKFGGTGLGLSISESFVKLMGGREICVESSPGRGSRFYFTLEFKKAQKKPAAAKIEDASASIPAQRSIMDQGGEKYKILVVDDNLINLELMKRIIDKSGHVSSGADSGEAALRLLEGDAFDLIIMDLQMPVMDGLETSAAIRGRNIITPIIAVSATTIERCAEKCSAAGIDAFVQKPVGFQSLKDIIQKYAAGRKKNAADLS